MKLKLVDAKVDEYLMLPEKRQRLVPGAINNSKDRVVGVPLSFLKSGNYAAEYMSDGEDAHTSPNKIKHESKSVKAADKLNLTLASGGGAVIHFRPE
jgi:hypothetical protein